MLRRQSRPTMSTRPNSACFACRTQLANCDERRPQCSRCADRNFECQWPHGFSHPAPALRPNDSSDHETSTAVDWARYNFFNSEDLGQRPASRALSRASSFGSMDSGVSHPPRGEREGKKIVPIRFSDFANRSTKETTEMLDYPPISPDYGGRLNIGPGDSSAIEEFGPEGNINSNEIYQYVGGPDASDGKWVCLFEDCGKRFGRKLNIKSHVRVHLHDRQYKCPTCQKCFVRQHDLKRHAKIHAGIKPYPCACGNSFARHDALTRHRQRGMCIGAFDGIVRKVKRGRPRHHPDLETRMEKSARSRENNMSSPGSSLSGYSDSSAVNSPGNDFNKLDDGTDLGLTPQTQHMSVAASVVTPTVNDLASASMIGPLPLSLSDPDDDMLRQFMNGDCPVQIDRDPNMLMMSRFDEEFDNSVAMPANNNDVFFGNT